ncbi:MAG: hypothetical protein GY759_04945 [Chloroflexi bacterium]|nr:hypothetical protein [Chloroflexota bacterium]
MKNLIYLLIALLIAAVGQRWLADGSIPRDSLILFIIAGAIFAAISASPLPWPKLPPRRKWTNPGMILTALAILLAGIATVAQFWRGEYGGWGLWLWLLSIPILVIGIWLDSPSPDPEAEQEAARAWHAPILDRRYVLIILILILAVAVAARFYALDVYPNGCQSDECNNGLDALEWLAGSGYTPYAETNEGQSTLFTYLIAGAISLLGPTVQSMRMVSALIGVLTVLVFYFLAREAYDQRIALLTTALLAADRWHITFSRIVYELIMVPLVLSLQALFLFKALKTGRRRWWLLSGMALALGMNTYTAYRVVPFFFAAYFAYWLIAHRNRIRNDFEGMLVFAAGAAVAVAPLAAYTIRNWGVFISRINHISVFRDVEIAGSYAPLWSNLRKTLLMFNSAGDNAALNNLPGSAILHAIVALMLILGLAWAIRWFWKELPLFYLLWFAAVASLAVLSVAHEAPSARRPIGLLPVIYLLVAAVFTQLWKTWGAAWGERRWRPLAVGLSALVIFVVGANVYTYFRVQAVNPSVWAAYSPNESAVGKYLADVSPDDRIYMTAQYTHHSAVKYIGGPHNITPLNLTRDIPLREDPGADVEFILDPIDERLIPLFQQLYPSGILEAHQDRFGRTLFFTYRIPHTAYDAARGLQAGYSLGSDAATPPVRGEQVDTLDFDYVADLPMAPPFTAAYEGALLVPRFGDYTFELLSTGGEAVLYLDEIEILRASEEAAITQRTLPGGFQSLRLLYTSTDDPGRLRLSWSTPDRSQMELVSGHSLYTLPGASNGLVGYYYSTPDWSGTPNLIQRDLFIVPNNVLREPYSIRWVGKLAAPTSGTYVFGTRSDDGSLVYIDGQLVVDNGGAHGAEYKDGMINLTEGFHDIEVRYNEVGGSREMQLWWNPPGAGHSVIQSAYLYPSEEELPQGLELPPLPTASLPEPVQTPVPLEADEKPPEQDPVVPAASLGEFSPSEADILWTYGSCGSADEQLQQPTGVAVGTRGDIYIADKGNQRIVHLNADGEYVDAWGEGGEEPGQFTELFDLVVTPAGEIAALDAVNQVISLWSPDGEFIRQFGSELATYRPRGFGISPSGDYFIADTGGVRIVQVGSDGQWVKNFGGADQPLGPGQPTDAAVGPDGTLYVTEPIAGALWLVNPISGDAKRYPGPEANTIESPHIAVTADGRILITDPELGRVLVYARDLSPVAQIGGKGNEPGRFGRAVGVAVGPNGEVVVTDPDLCRVTVFAGAPR